MEKDLNELAHSENASVISHSCTVSDHIKQVRKNGMELRPKESIFPEPKKDKVITPLFPNSKESSFMSHESVNLEKDNNFEVNLALNQGLVPNSRVLLDQENEPQ